MTLLIIAFIAGIVVDNLFAPKLKITDGKVTLEWSNTKKEKQ